MMKQEEQKSMIYMWGKSHWKRKNQERHILELKLQIKKFQNKHTFWLPKESIWQNMRIWWDNFLRFQIQNLLELKTRFQQLEKRTSQLLNQSNITHSNLLLTYLAELVYNKLKRLLETLLSQHKDKNSLRVKVRWWWMILLDLLKNPKMKSCKELRKTENDNNELHSFKKKNVHLKEWFQPLLTKTLLLLKKEFLWVGWTSKQMMMLNQFSRHLKSMSKLQLSRDNHLHLESKDNWAKHLKNLSKPSQSQFKEENLKFPELLDLLLVLKLEQTRFNKNFKGQFLFLKKKSPRAISKSQQFLEKLHLSKKKSNQQQSNHMNSLQTRRNKRYFQMRISNLQHNPTLLIQK